VAHDVYGEGRLIGDFERLIAGLTGKTDAIAERDGVWVIGSAKAAEVPGWSVNELYVGDTLVGLGNDEVVPRLRALVG
jgi:hypothetical protein